MRIASLTLAALFSLVACEDDVVCTLASCSDQASIDVKRPDSSWPAGEYTLSLSIDDGKWVTCALSVPADLPSGGSVFQVPCEPSSADLYVSFWQDTACTEQRTGDTASQTCEPIADRYSLHITLEGKPSYVMLELQLGDDTPLAVSPTLKYEDVSPNGPECGVDCSQAHHDIIIR